MDDKIVKAIDKLFEEARQGNKESFEIIGEIFNEFIILEKDDNMYLLDFHAGHERLNYDKFTQMVENRSIVIQDLLIPIPKSTSLKML